MKCTKCLLDLPIDNFQIRTDTGKPRRQCKICRSEYRKSHYANNRERTLDVCAQYYLKNKKKYKERAANYYKLNKSSFSERSKKWYVENPDKSRINSKLSSARFRKSAYGRFREMIRSSARRYGCKFEIKNVNYSLDDFLKRIEYNFKDGMSWDNYGEWEIDHIKPVKRFYDQGKFDINLVNALCNLKPLWKIENRKKSCSLLTVK
jgi:hypothetical protein